MEAQQSFKLCRNSILLPSGVATAAATKLLNTLLIPNNFNFLILYLKYIKSQRPSLFILPKYQS